MWCKCGLPVSLQVESLYFRAKVLAVLLSLCARTRDLIFHASIQQLVVFLIQILANGLNEFEIFVWILSQPFVIGVVIGAALEVCLCIYEIIEAILTDELLNAKLVEIIAKGVCSFGLGTTGSAVGLAYGGLLGSLAGNILGSLIACRFIKTLLRDWS
jgi:hypothetical protein